MNRSNNKRRRESKRRIGAAFIGLLQTRELEQITVTDICAEAGVNRTTFYANFEDIYGLVEELQRELCREVQEIYRQQENRLHDNGFLALFRHIRDNQLFYKTYFKLEGNRPVRLLGNEAYQYTDYYGQTYYDGRHMEYHIAFFESGLNAIIKKWLENSCRESPEEMAQVIISEYAPKGGLRTSAECETVPPGADTPDSGPAAAGCF